MNFLAHAVLSFGNPGILTGNISGDFVKGKGTLLSYPQPVRNGIILHRLIDEFTDQHEATLRAKSFFRKDYRLYAGAFIDIAYDHFLANDKTEFKDDAALLKFTQNVYKDLESRSGSFPEKFKRVFPYMEEENWLYDYRLRQGMQRAFNGLVRRALYIHESEPAFRIFNQHYEELKESYQLFLPDIKAYVKNELQQLRSL